MQSGFAGPLSVVFIDAKGVHNTKIFSKNRLVAGELFENQEGGKGTRIVYFERSYGLSENLL